PTDDRVYTMYHGTNVASAKAICSEGFRQSAGGMLGRGVYVSRNIDKARRYPLDTEDHLKVILKLEVDVGKVKKIDSQNHPLRLTWHDEGYDTAWVPAGCGMVTSQLEEDCVWDPERVKVVDITKLFGSVLVSMPNVQGGESPKDDRRYIMYHGTDVQGAHGILTQGFRRSARGMLGPGVYVSRDIEKARRYPIGKPENTKVILKLRVNVGRVKKIDGQDHPLRLTWHDEGYDTAWVPRGCGMVTSELEEDCVWDPERITVVGVEEAPSSKMKTTFLAMLNPN
uniref:PARP catalytic domain-containing protein n=1 Tax=Petromyzon marinus TaxID=7757 RepID=S4RLZ3_PETMA